MDLATQTNQLRRYEEARPVRLKTIPPAPLLFLVPQRYWGHLLTARLFVLMRDSGATGCLRQMNRSAIRVLLRLLERAWSEEELATSR